MIRKEKDELPSIPKTLPSTTKEMLSISLILQDMLIFEVK
jgi:hypothetical protein